MFTFKALKPARKMGQSSGKATPKRPTTRLWLETLEDRTMPSATPTNAQPINTTDSPQAASAAAAITSYLFTMMQQGIATIEQDLSNALYVVGQVIAQELAAFEVEADSFFGIDLGASDPSDSGSGSGSGAATTAYNDLNQSLGTATPESASGSGSDGGMGSMSGSCNYYSRIVQLDETEPVNVPEEAGMCTPSSATLAVSVENPNANCPAIAVNYATANGSATAGVDYTTTNGTLNFAPGQSTPDYITVPILDDGDDESVGSESFYVNLSNPVNAILGNPIRATVNIEEGPQQAATDTLIWNPCPGGDDDASDPLNWYDATQGFQLQKGAPGPGPSTPIIFDGTPTTQTPDDDSAITWDDPKVPSWTLENGYNQQQTINAGDTIELTGNAQGTSLSMDGTSWLNLNFASKDPRKI